MEGFSTHLSQILSNYTYDTLRQITKKLSGAGTKKPEMVSYIIGYLCKPENHSKIGQVFPPELAKELSKVLPDKDLSCICDDCWKVSNLITCTVCSKKLHTACMGNLTFQKKFTCITCQFKILNPSDEVLQFLVSPFIIPENREKSVSFNYSATLANEISNVKTATEVQLRCIKIQSPGFCINWPKNGTLSINKRNIKEFKSDKNRKEVCLDISILLKVGTNEIGFSKKQDSEDYCLAVVKVRKNTVDSLFQKFVKNVQPVEKCLRLLNKTYLPEKDLKASHIKIVFKCPYSLQNIKYPARGKKCSHVSCFDLSNFIEFQKFENYYWKCPICKGPAYDVYVDGYLLSILQQYDQLDAVEISEDGTIQPLFEEKHQSEEKKSRPEKVIKKKIKPVEIVIIQETAKNLIIID